MRQKFSLTIMRMMPWHNAPNISIIDRPSCSSNLCSIFLGSAALNFAFVAAGNCDIYCHAGIRCWDMAAGALLVQEAGGVVLDPSGKGTNLRILKFYVVILDSYEQVNLESD